MKRLDKIISTLFLAVSPKRETVLKSMIENIIYLYNESLIEGDIFNFIKSEFMIEPIRHEFEETLIKLRSEGRVVSNNGKYNLSEYRKKEIFTAEEKLRSIETKRYERFIQKNIDYKITDNDLSTLLWNKFNEYIYNCFLNDGKDAIYSFLPHNSHNGLYSNRINILSELRNDLDEFQYKELVKIINDYPKLVDQTELEFLNSIAEKTESFYSLGMDEEVYENTTNLKFNNLVVFADTNVLFTVLNIHSNPQDRAINELLNIAQNFNIGIKFRFLPITSRELNAVKNDLSATIQRTEFQPSHMRAAIESGELDGFTRYYFEQKLNDPETPNPVYVLEDSRTVLASRGFSLYNTKFNFYEEENFLLSKFQEYYEYESMVNKVRANHGMLPKHKKEAQIRHDILLRETIKASRSRQNSELELKFLAITLDNQLLRFDHYLSSEKIRRESSVIQPNFISPTNFLRRIRALIPVKTENYKRAFISAMTNLTLPTGNKDQSIKVQKSLSYFKKLGIEDEGAILKIVKNELLYKKLNSIEDETERDIFIQSEVEKYLKELREQRKFEQTQTNKKISLLNKEIEKKVKDNEKLKTDNEIKNQKIFAAENDIKELKAMVKALQNDQHLSQIQKRQKEFIESNWTNDLSNYRNGLRKLLFTFCITIIPIVGIWLTDIYASKIDTLLVFPNLSSSLKLVFLIIAGFGVLHRFLAKKEGLAESWTYFIKSLRKKSFNDFKEKKFQEYENNFSES